LEQSGGDASLGIAMHVAAQVSHKIVPIVFWVFMVFTVQAVCRRISALLGGKEDPSKDIEILSKCGSLKSKNKFAKECPKVSPPNCKSLTCVLFPTNFFHGNFFLNVTFRG
jgi:hypothetical protein